MVYFICKGGNILKKIMKIGCGSIIGLFVLLIIIGMLVGGEETAEQDNTPETPNAETAQTDTSSESTETKEEPKEEAPAAIGIGQVLEVGDAAFTVNNVRTDSKVGNQYLNSTAQGVYLIANVTYQNNGNEATMVDTSFFRLKFGDKTYDADSTASLYANSKDDGSSTFFAENVNPDLSVTGEVVFDVTQEVASAQGLQLQVQTGFWGTETGLINIQ